MIFLSKNAQKFSVAKTQGSHPKNDFCFNLILRWFDTIKITDIVDQP